MLFFRFFAKLVHSTFSEECYNSKSLKKMASFSTVDSHEQVTNVYSKQPADSMSNGQGLTVIFSTEAQYPAAQKKQ
jgi:hypothetical protein